MNKLEEMMAATLSDLQDLQKTLPFLERNLAGAMHLTRCATYAATSKERRPGLPIFEFTVPAVVGEVTTAVKVALETRGLIDSPQRSSVFTPLASVAYSEAIAMYNDCFKLLAAIGERMNKFSVAVSAVNEDTPSEQP